MRRLLLLISFVLAACSPPEDPLQRALALQTQGRFEESIEPLVSLVESGDRSPKLMYQYGLALSMTGRTSQALWPLQESLKDPEWFVPASMRLASDAYRGGNFDIAIDFTSDILGQEPDHIDALKLRCLARLQSRRDYEGALSDAERVIELDPERRDMDGPRIVALLGLERIDEAEAALAEFEEQQVAVDGSDLLRDGQGNAALACAVRAKFATEKGDEEAAGEIYARCLESYPADHTIVNEAIDFYQEAGQHGKIDAILHAAHEADLADRGFRVALARRLQLQGKESEAEAVLRSGTEHGDVDAWMDLAGYLNQVGRADEGFEAYDQALAASLTPSPELLLAHAEALINAGRLDEAWQASERMGVPSHRAFTRGRVHLNRGEHAEALEAFTEGVRLWPDNAVARYYTARAAEALGDFERATEEYRYALRVDPDAADTRLRLARLHLASGHAGDALYTLNYQGLGRQAPTRSFESALLELEALALLGELAKAPAALFDSVRSPAQWGPAIAAVAAGTRRRLGPAAAIEVVRGADRLNILHPLSAPALRGLAADLAALEQHAAALALVRKALEAHDVAVFSEILGEALVRAGKPDAARAAFERALELEPGRPAAVMGLAALREQAGERDAALALYQGLEQEALADNAPLLAHAALLASAGRQADAEAALLEALERDPYDGAAALALAKLRLAAGAQRKGTRLLERAVLFGGGSEARELLARHAASASGSLE